MMVSRSPSIVSRHTLPKRLPCLCLLSQDRLALIAPLFATAFKNGMTETTKQDMQWAIFKLLHEQPPIPLVEDAMIMIEDSLQQEEAPAVVRKLGETDVWRGRKPKAYCDRTSMFVDENECALNAEAKTMLVERVVLQLGEEGFRFLEGKPEDGDVCEMSILSAINIVEKQML